MTPPAQQTIEIVPYTAAWFAEFREHGEKLRRSLGDLALRIDHIGSTSVAGLAAKDIVDIQVAVASLDPDEEIIARVADAGFRLIPGITEDHRPPGDEQAAGQWQKRFFRESGGCKRTHVHVRVDGAANQRYALLFRDYLRANRQAMLTYEQIKRTLARLHPDNADAYYDIKDPVCDLIMHAARIWAAAADWQPGPSDA